MYPGDTNNLKSEAKTVKSKKEKARQSHLGTAGKDKQSFNSSQNMPSMERFTETKTDRFENYWTFFEKIFQETQLNDIDEIVDAYNQCRPQNDKLYEEVTNLGNEVIFDKKIGIFLLKKKKRLMNWKESWQISKKRSMNKHTH